MIDFFKVEQSVRELKSRLVTGEIDRKSFELRLLDMIDIAADGCYWMYGHKSEIWYRHDGKQWVLEDPGTLRLLAPTQSSSALDLKSNIVLGWQSINWGWFVAGLIVLGLIGWFVFYSNPF